MKKADQAWLRPPPGPLDARLRLRTSWLRGLAPAGLELTTLFRPAYHPARHHTRLPQNSQAPDPQSFTAKPGMYRLPAFTRLIPPPAGQAVDRRAFTEDYLRRVSFW